MLTLLCSTALNGVALPALSVAPAHAQSVSTSGDVIPNIPGSIPNWDLGSSATLQIGDTGTGTMTVEEGGTVSNGYGFIGTGAGANGMVVITGSNSVWTNASQLAVGHEGTGMLTIEDGGAVIGSGFIALGESGEGTVTVTGNGSRWTAPRLEVGYQGTGTLNIDDGGTVSAGLVGIGFRVAGAHGTVNLNGIVGARGVLEAEQVVSGPGTAIFNLNGGILRAIRDEADFLDGFATGDVTIGAGGGFIDSNGFGIGIGADLQGGGGLTKQGAGTLTLTGDSSVFSGATTVSEGTLAVTGQLGSSSATIGYTGSDLNATATATVSGVGASWVNSGSVSIGASGKGALIVENGGGIVSSGDNHIGSGGGVVTVTGPGSRWATDRIMVGHDGAGELNITEGGEVNTSSSSFIGGWVGLDGTGTATVSGDGSTWNVGANLLVGFRDAGELTIANGGEVNQENGIVGGGIEVPGTVLVTGAGSSWISRNSLFVGSTGIGELTVAAGGYIESAEGSIGAYPDLRVRGAVTVTGQNSKWVNSGDLHIGGGKGTLTIVNDGAVSAGGGITLGSGAGDNGTLTIGAAAGNAAASAGVLTTPSIEFGDGAGTLVFNHSDSDYVFSAALQSTGTGTDLIDHIAGDTILTGASSGFTGNTIVHGGTLSVNGTLGGTVNVESGGTLGGTGVIGGDVDVDGILSAGNSPGSLKIASDLTLNATSTSVFELNTPGVVGGTGATGNDLVYVVGNLTLGGALDARVAAAGYYRLFNYDGALTGTFNSSTLTGTGGFTPLSPTNPDIRYDTPNQVNLSVLAAGQTMQFWDGGNATGNGMVDGGAGTWTGFATNWTDNNGSTNGGWGGSVGVFAGASGAVTVDGTQSFDTLQFSTDGYTLTGGTLALSPASGTAGTLNIDNSVSTTIGSTIADGTGTGLRKTGGGTLTLTGANTYSGGTELLGGMLSISSDANLGAPSGGLTFGGGTLATTADMQIARDVSLAVTGVFDVAAGTELGLAGVISGSDLRKDGSGTLRLTGTNSYGNTLVWDGTLIGDTRSISGSIGNNATVVFDQAFDGTFAGSTGPFTAPGGVMIKRGAGTLTLAGPSALDWTIEAGGLVTAAERFDGGAEIFVGASLAFEQVADAAYDGALSGTGSFLKAGAGTLLYDGDGSGFTGNTTITDGGLIVGSGAANAGAVLGGSFDVQDGGTLGGHGTVGSGAGSMVTIASGGTIAPGNSIGTLTVDGDITFDAGSTYLAEISPALDSDLIDASGAATIGGGTVHAVKAAGVYTPGSRWTIIGADGGVTGTFDDLTQNMPFVDLALAYDANHVYIDATRNAVAFCDVAGTFNQCSTGDGLETTGAGNPVYDAVAALADGESARRALDLLSGEVHASAKSALIEDSRFVRNAANDRIRAAFDNAGAPVTPVLAYGPGDTPTAVAADYAGPVFWSHAFGSWGSIDSDGNAASLDRNTGGVLIGADAIAGDWRIGLLTGYSHSSFDIDDRVSSGSSDNYHLGLYGGTEWGNLAFRTGAAYSWLDIDTHRSVSIPGFTDNLSGDYNTGIFQVFGELGYDLELDAGTRFEPFANLAHVHLRTDGFGETGGEATLSASGGNTDVTFTTLGLRGEHGIALGTIDATLRGMVGWRHAFGDVTPESIHAFSTGNAFTIAGAPIAENAAVIEAGLDLDLTPDATVSLSYAGQFSGSAQDHGFKANFNVRF